jgi:16S rRNA (guanine966-N2)-methyltransferase
MRISGGEARGIKLLVPKGDAVRPATDGLRQAVFSSLAGRLAGARFLDLFAGSGAYGLEALSRGAAGGAFVEQNAKAVACLRHNLAAVCRSLGRGLDGLEIRQADALRGGTAPDGPVPDLVFVDPPYELIPGIAPRLFTRLAAMLAGHPEALVIFEAPGGGGPDPAGWTCLKEIGRGLRQPTARIFRLGNPP